ncbi:flavin-dependent oxidoreductase [Microbispora sp. ZYX-F-249]|uniref:Flavin-dependent oxidoreductase n=1 Tax=Microbispora maris TaxID=3144104 RepID=A0ABV0ARG8_9ACTN
MSRAKIVIAGAGIGGLTAALSLHAVGLTDVTLLEAATTIEPIGVGLNILPNAVRELDELGLGDRLLGVAMATGSLSYYNRFGQLIWNEPRGKAAGHRWPQLSIHRGRLQAVLLDAVLERLGPGAVVAGSRVTGFENRPDGTVEIEVAHQVSGAVSHVTADVLIGADGIHSGVRAAMYPGEGPPRWNRLIVWRGSTWAGPFLDGRTMVIAGDARRRAVVYPLTRPEGPSERVLMNWAVARRAGDDEFPDRADWNRPVDPERFLAGFDDLRFGWLDVPALIRSGQEALEYPMVDRDPLPAWTSGRATLLGDAAHAMHPMGSNGATQSIVDGRVLAAALAGHDDIGAALAAYENERRPRTTALQEASRRMGPEVVIDIADQRAPDGFDSIDAVIPPDELARISAGYAQLAGSDPEMVNARPPGRPAAPAARPSAAAADGD